MSRGRIMPGHRIVGPPPGKRPSELEDSFVAASTGKDSVIGDYHVSEEEVVGIGEGVHSSIPNDDMVELSGIQISHAAPPGAHEATTRLSGVPPPDVDIRSPPTPSGEAEIVAPRPDDSIVQADRTSDGYLSGRESVESAGNSEELRSSSISQQPSGGRENEKEKRTNTQRSRWCNVL